MKRLRRILFNVMSAVSALLFVATVLLWVRAYRTDDFLLIGRLLERPDDPFARQAPFRTIRIHTFRGSIAIRKGDELLALVGRYVSFITPTKRPEGDDSRPFKGKFAFASDPWGFDIEVPFWAMALGFVLLPGVYVATKFRQLKRVRMHLCARCGYDLRATPERCPECGHVPSPP